MRRPFEDGTAGRDSKQHLMVEHDSEVAKSSTTDSISRLVHLEKGMSSADNNDGEKCAGALATVARFSCDLTHLCFFVLSYHFPLSMEYDKFSEVKQKLSRICSKYSPKLAVGQKLVHVPSTKR